MNNAIQEAKNKAQAEILHIVESACIDERYSADQMRAFRSIAITGADIGFMAGVDYAIREISEAMSGVRGLK